MVDSLEAQVAEAAKIAETAEQLRGEIAELKAQGESGSIDFKLQLAGMRYEACYLVANKYPTIFFGSALNRQTSWPVLEFQTT